MYDWHETRGETDEEWARLRGLIRDAGFDAPERRSLRNADLPPVPGGIRDDAGRILAPDPATLPPDELDVHALWLHPQLLLAQTCWGPMELGLANHVTVVGQPSYEGFEGGRGELYSSAILMRRSAEHGVAAPSGDSPLIPLDRIRGKRLAYNSLDSMSGIMALARDLEALGESLDIFSERIATGAHRASIAAVVEGRADVCAIDCRTWRLAQLYKPRAADVAPVGWTGKRKGLPLITSKKTPPEVVAALRDILSRRYGAWPIRSAPLGGCPR